MRFPEKNRLQGFLVIAICFPALCQTAEEAAWNNVVAEQRQGLRLREQEREATGDRRISLYRQRVEAFRRATSRMDDYIKTFLRDPASVRYLNATFQMGYYSEFAGWDERALALYKVCRRHEKLQDSAAVFGVPPEPLASYVPKRIDAVLRRLNAGGNPSTSIHNQFAFAKYSGKGGIDLRGIGAPKPLSAEDEPRVAQRLSFPDKVDRARKDWRQLLEQRPELRPVEEDASYPGMLVFTARGSREGTKKVASLLDFYRRELMERYFDSALPAPTLVVLANLTSPEMRIPGAAGGFFPNAAMPVMAPPTVEKGQPVQQQVQQQQSIPQQIRIPVEGGGLDAEEIGRILSTTAHFRDMRDMEGYYESLDHTLVLRKNLVGRGGELFLGTGLHELVHALMQVDYPQAPLWLNEGMAALHEAYGPDVPHDNYRLYVARAAIDAGRWLTLQELLEPRPELWASDARPVMVAAARYFCMFLMKEGQLQAVYKAMRRADQSGGASAGKILQEVTGQPLEALNARWRADILRRNLDLLDNPWRELREPIRRYMETIPQLASIR